MVGLGVASTMHSSFTNSSFLIAPKGSGTLTNTGPPIYFAKDYFYA